MYLPEYAVIIEHVNKQYAARRGEPEKIALEDMCLQIPAGVIFCVAWTQWCREVNAYQYIGRLGYQNVGGCTSVGARPG